MKKSTIIAWTLAGIILISTVANMILLLANRQSQNDLIAMGQSMLFSIISVVFGLLAALIILRQPGNVIGWLLFMPVLSGILSVDEYIKTFVSAPIHPPLMLILALWFSSWSWLLLVFPIFFIPVLFPIGRPPSPRWRWLIVAGLIMCAIFLFFATFHRSFSADNQGMDWKVTNPIGFIPDLGNFFLIPWFVGLFLLAVLSAASLFIRYRQAETIEREQIKWLFYACSLFAVFYIVSGVILFIAPQSVLNMLFNMLWGLCILTIPASIAIAILRYRLWDIDVIIRRTLIYGSLTIVLGLIFFSVVVLLQQVLVRLTGAENSSISIVISTLAIAAIFNRLRIRLQNGIDRRFYRKKYNAEQALARFSVTARAETGIEQVSAELLTIVQETMQPQAVSLWMRPAGSRKQARYDQP